MSDRGLIEQGQDDRGGNIYNITEKGRELAKHLSLVMAYLELDGNHAA
jgi:DNA-binding PadR family transcriptional regulator